MTGETLYSREGLFCHAADLLHIHLSLRLYDHSETACMIDLRPSIGEIMRFIIGRLGVTFMGIR